MLTHHDYLIVGSGLFGAVFAYEATKRGKSCLVVEKRSHPGGNIYCEDVENIAVHKYGAHIFHTSNKTVWDYVNALCKFNRYTNCPVANYKGKLFNLPFNMNTFHQLWGVVTPEEAMEKLREQRSVFENVAEEPKNLEEQAQRLVGRDIFEYLIKGYTEKQWGRSCSELPAFIIRRLPLRFTYDNNYFNDDYQGIPIGGYNRLFEPLLEGSKLLLDTDYLQNRESLDELADKVVYTGMADAYFDYCYGSLEYRSLRFEHDILDKENYQGVAVMNYTDNETPFTRVIEHKHFEYGLQPKTVVTWEYPAEWKSGLEPYYPVNDDKNQEKARKYQELARSEGNVIFGGRLAEYKYYDMDQVIASALEAVNKEFGG